MSEPIATRVAKWAELLGALVEEKLAPSEALRRVEQQRSRSGDPDVELVWQREVDDSICYDLLVRESHGTWSLALSPADTLPWPLRGAHRWDDRELLRVDGVVLRIDQALARLDLLHDTRFVATLIDAAILEGELASERDEVTDAELQDAIDQFRRGRGLHTTAATIAWLHARHLTQEALEAQLVNAIRIRRLRARIVCDRRRGADCSSPGYDQLHFVRFDVAAVDLAHQLGDELRSDPLAAMATRLPFARPILGSVLRRDAPQEIGFDLDNAAAGTVLFAARSDVSGAAVCRILRVDPAASDAAQHALADTLFADWLRERRDQATVEWNWGSADRTGAARFARGGSPCGD